MAHPFWRAVLALAALLLAGLSSAQRTASEAELPALLGQDYPIEAPLSFPGALLHWLDSLAHLRGAGLTAGKTVEAHRQSYLSTFEVPSEEDQRLLESYHKVRFRFASGPTRDRNGLTRAFFETDRLDEALKRAATLLDERDQAMLEKAVRHFAGRYERIWDEGEIARGFLEAVRASDRRDELARFLVGVAEFYGIDPQAAPVPRLVLAPVAPNVGTHAQAIDHFLLVEVRRGDTLLDQVAPIVHENAHLLFQRMGPSRIRELERAAQARGPLGQAAWQHLKEALPTAIAQGVAQLTFDSKSWSMQNRWYDVEVVDVFAKRIFPNVKRALSSGRSLDTAMIDELVEVYTRAVATRTARPPATPRSP
jgi:hypothetical protein